MSNCKSVSDVELRVQTKSAVQRERECMMEVLEHLREVERRMLYAQWSYTSMNAYCLYELGYSEDEADRRVRAMRLVRDLPEAKEAIAAGTITMTGANALQHFYNRAGTKPEQKKEVFEQVLGKTTREAHKILVSICPIQVPEQKEKEKALSSEFTKLELVVSQEFINLYQELTQINSEEQLNMPTYIQLFTQLVKKELERLKARKLRTPAAKEPRPSAAQREKAINPTSAASRVSSTVPASAAQRAKPTKPGYVSAQTKRELIQRDGHRCTHLDPQTGHRCKETRRLEPDHIIPKAHQGSDHITNLRLACPTHNHYYAVQIFGADKMSRYTSP